MPTTSKKPVIIPDTPAKDRSGLSSEILWGSNVHREPRSRVWRGVRLWRHSPVIGGETSPGVWRNETEPADHEHGWSSETALVHVASKL